jgi:hypothetical protein
MIISRRPNNRQSADKEPGPSRATAEAIVTTRIAGSGVVNRFAAGSGNHARAIPNVATAIAAPASGVRNPINRESPPATFNKPTNQDSAVALALSVR